MLQREKKMYRQGEDEKKIFSENEKKNNGGMEKYRWNENVSIRSGSVYCI